MCGDTQLTHMFLNHNPASDFSRHPATDGPLPAELCNRIELMDRLLEANGQSLRSSSIDEAKKTLGARADTVSLLLESSYKRISTWFCKPCGMQNHLTESTMPMVDLPVVCKYCNQHSLYFTDQPLLIDLS